MKPKPSGLPKPTFPTRFGIGRTNTKRCHLIDESKLATPLHALYKELTGGSEPLTLQRIMAWSYWAKDNTADDLKLVVGYMKQEIREGRKWASALTFRRLIEDSSGWQEALSMARSHARTPKYTSKDAVLAQSGRPRPTEYKVTKAGEAAFEALRKLKESL